MVAPNNKTEWELRKMNAEWVEAFVNADTIALDRIMADDCTFIYPLEGDSKQEFIANIASGDMRAEKLVRENVEVRVYGQTAVVTGFDTATWNYKGRSINGHYRTIHVYAEREGRWQVVAIQACPLR